MDLLFSFTLIIVIMLIGTDVMLHGSPAVQRRYRAALRAVFTFVRRHTVRFVRWAWQNYRQGIIGFILGLVAATYFAGRPQ